MSDQPRLLRIDEAAVLLHRSVRTLRWWCSRGFAPDGTRLRVHEDVFTGVRYLEKVQVAALRAAMFKRVGVG
mgnify:CR=1 FL=1